MIFTIITPTYNRAYTLDIVFESLKMQTIKGFEWLVVDDGSLDDTRNLIAKWKKTVPFPIRYYWQENAGKHVAINRAVKLAKGKFILIADSDDSFKNNTLQKFFEYWNRLPNDQKRRAAGVACLAIDGHKEKLIGKKHDVFTPSLILEYSYNLKHRRNFEQWGTWRRDILSRYPFPEIEQVKFIPEGFVWNRICRKYPRVVTNEILRKIYFQKDGFSVNTRINYNRHARGFYIYFLHNLLQNAELLFKYNLMEFIKEIIQLNRVGTHDNINPCITFKYIKKKPLLAFFFWPALFAGYLLAMLDRYQLERI